MGDLILASSSRLILKKFWQRLDFFLREMEQQVSGGRAGG
jgi:hypothetical protein